MKCPNCGSYIRDDSRFCNYCGERVIMAGNLPKPEILSEQKKAAPEVPPKVFRPRDENFEINETEIVTEQVEEKPQQKGGVIFLLILCAAIFAVIALLGYTALKKNQRTSVNVTTAATEETTEEAAAAGETATGENAN